MLENEKNVVDSEVENNEIEVNKSFTINDFNSENEVTHKNSPTKKSSFILILAIAILIIIGLGVMYTTNKDSYDQKILISLRGVDWDSAMEIQKIENQDILFTSGDASESTPMSSDEYSLLFYDVAYFENDESFDFSYRFDPATIKSTTSYHLVPKGYTKETLYDINTSGELAVLFEFNNESDALAASKIMAEHFKTYTIQSDVPGTYLKGKYLIYASYTVDNQDGIFDLTKDLDSPFSNFFIPTK